MDFKLTTELKPQGDQPKAIEALAKKLKSGVEHQVLHGVTGSGKTFTMANVIAELNKPTLVISHNKTLAWQLYQEFREFFSENAVHYFVSYYDYYQPEAYISQTDTYIAKDASINKKIDKMRHAAVQSILTRPDTIVVASVSCIYGIGSPEDYQGVSLNLHKGQQFKRQDLLHTLVVMGFARNDFDPSAGSFRAKGNRVEIYPPTGEAKAVVELEGSAKNEKIASITLAGIDTAVPDTAVSGGVYGEFGEKEHIKIFPSNFWVTPEDKLKIAMQNIRAELHDRLKGLKERGRDIEAYRLEQKTNYDLELMEQMGYCPGIENYSRHLDFREPGTPPFTLVDYFGHTADNDFLTIIDESHMTIPQIRGMYAGDRARKTNLIQHGFRLPSAVDNRPLKFGEFEKRVVQPIYVSATPGEYETEKAGKKNIVEQIVRPTGLLDPPIEVRPTENQMKNAISEIEKQTAKGQRTIVVTITKRLAEEIAEYLNAEGIKVQYIHSEIHTLKRPPIMQKLREGEYDVLVGINLLREGLDFPEVSLVIIFDADKEGFLRNETTLLQTVGRAARHVEGRAIMYADKTTDSMKAALKETERRRKIQTAFNKEHGIDPKTIVKKIYRLPEDLEYKEEETSGSKEYEDMAIKELEKEMNKAAKEMDFEKAAKLRDKINKLKDLKDVSDQ